MLLLLSIWRHSQVVRQGSAKPRFPGSNPGVASKRSQQYRCRRWKRLRHNCFQGFGTPKFDVSSNRCQQRFFRNWRDLNPWFRHGRAVLAA